MDDNVVLDVNDLTKVFKNRVKAVDNLSFSIKKGDIFGFLGPNGAGKTTTIRLILGLLRPDKGDVHISSHSVKKDFYKAVSKVGALVEGPAFYDYLSARENLEVFGNYSGGVTHAKIDETLKIVGLAGRSNDKVKNYSLGMKQRLGIAQALINSPELLILDEPTNGLDPFGIREIRKLITDLSKNKGITILVSSHILSEVQQMCNRLLIINKGKKIIEGSADELLNTNNLIYEVVCDDYKKLEEVMSRITGVTHIVTTRSYSRYNLHTNPPEYILKQLIFDGVNIKAFGPYKADLEEFFFNAVEEDNTDEIYKE